MTDDLVADAESDLAPRFVEFPLEQFWDEKAMWAANYFVLWPLGLALTVDVGTVPREPLAWCGGDSLHGSHPTGLEFPGSGTTCQGTTPGDVTNLHVRHWEYPLGELEETIDMSQAENEALFKGFLTFVHRRLVNMKPDERRLLLGRYKRFDVASAEQILLAVD